MLSMAQFPGHQDFDCRPMLGDGHPVHIPKKEYEMIVDDFSH